eukprot:13687281-Alexandrium_andersonii.AAC.1
MTWRRAGDHIGTELERHPVWQANHDVEFMGTRSFFYHDCLDFVDVAAFDYNHHPDHTLAKDAKKM